MQSERGYGFLLKAPRQYPETEYQEMKAGIEKICTVAEKNCNRIGVLKLNFAIYVKDSIFISIGVQHGKAEFALFDKNAGRLIQECNIHEFGKYVNQSRLEVLAYRIENECQAISQGRRLNRQDLDAAWNKLQEARLNELETKNEDTQRHWFLKSRKR